jgi:PAS domain S-box-containing protein
MVNTWKKRTSSGVGIQDSEEPDETANWPAEEAARGPREPLDTSLLLRATLDSAVGGVLVADLVGNVLYHNKEFAAIWGLPPDLGGIHDRPTLALQAAAQAKDPEMYLRLTRELQAHPDTEASDTVELKDGRIIERFVKPQRIGDALVGCVVHFSDITERKRAERELRNSERFMCSLIESLPQNILRKDVQGRFTFANNLFCRTVGKTMDQIIGKTDYDLFPSKLAAKFRRDDQEVMASGKLFETVEENLNTAGETIYVQVIKTPLYDEENRLIGLQVVFWDVTARMQAEARLEKAQKRLVELSRHAGMAEVATSVLHNVGNVLNSVNVSVCLLSEQVRRSKLVNLSRAAALLHQHAKDLGAFITLDPKGQQIPQYLEQLAEYLVQEQSSLLQELESLTKNVEHIKDIVGMQQSYAQVAGVKETVKLAELVEDALRMNAGALGRHGVQVIREFDPASLPEIIVEKHKVLQILINVIRNAKYACDDSESPDKRLTVRVTSEDERVEISLTDNGVGIPPKNLVRIFNHGFTTRKDGHGFGLHSAALAAQEMGGTLSAHSDGLGHGATFTLRLPRTTKPASTSCSVAG